MGCGRTAPSETTTSSLPLLIVVTLVLVVSVPQTNSTCPTAARQQCKTVYCFTDRVHTYGKGGAY